MHPLSPSKSRPVSPSLQSPVSSSLVNLIKRPRIIPTTLPNLIHDPGRLNIIPTTRSRSNTQRSPPSHTLLHLLRQAHLAPRKKLTRPSTLSTQHTSSNLHASSMSEIQRIQFKSQKIIGVHHFVRQCVFEVATVAELVGAEQDAVVRGEAPGLSGGAATTGDVLRRNAGRAGAWA